MSFDYISLTDLSNLPALPIECKLTFVAVGLFFLGYVVGLIDREPRVKIDIDLGPRPTIAPLTDAEVEASAVLGDNVGLTAMGISMPSAEEIKARQAAIAKEIKKPKRKPITRKKPRGR